MMFHKTAALDVGKGGWSLVCANSKTCFMACLRLIYAGKPRSEVFSRKQPPFHDLDGFNRCRRRLNIVASVITFLPDIAIQTCSKMFDSTFDFSLQHYRGFKQKKSPWGRISTRPQGTGLQRGIRDQCLATIRPLQSRRRSVSDQP